MEMATNLQSFTKAELSEKRLTLSDWQSPGAFLTNVDELLGRITAWELFHVPALGFLRDAWTLSQFASLSEVQRVRLSSPQEQFPDGQVEATGRIFQVEIAEAILPGRRRAEEFGPDAPTLIDDPGEQWDLRLDALPGTLEKTIKKKQNKRYSPPPTLVVYLNISAYGHRDAEMRSAIGRIKQHYAPEFDGLHILWQRELL
jgi:hypothetical protein